MNIQFTVSVGKLISSVLTNQNLPKKSSVVQDDISMLMCTWHKYFKNTSSICIPFISTDAGVETIFGQILLKNMHRSKNSIRQQFSSPPYFGQIWK